MKRPGAAEPKFQAAVREGPETPKKPGGKVKAHDGAVFTGNTVHEAALYAKAAHYKPNQIFEMSGARYQPPKAAAPATPTTTTTPRLRIDSNGEPPVRCDSRATVMKTLEQTMLLEGYNNINRDYAVTRWFMTLGVNASGLLWQCRLTNLKRNEKMNNNQRIAIAVALAIIGSVLLYVMAYVGHDARGAGWYTLILSWEDGWKEWPSGIPSKKYLYITHGIPGLLLGLVTPLSLWAVAAYITLGLARGSKVQS
jgi:hypothetical protein